MSQEELNQKSHSTILKYIFVIGGICTRAPPVDLKFLGGFCTSKRINSGQNGIYKAFFAVGLCLCSCTGNQLRDKTPSEVVHLLRDIDATNIL